MTAAEIKHWLATVANARLAVAQVLGQPSAPSGVSTWELDGAATSLEDAYIAGLDAHGQAVLKEYLAESKIDPAA